MPPAANTTSRTPASTPERSLVQRMDALSRANQIRTRRAQLKRDLKAGRVSIQNVLLEPPDWVETAKVFDMMLAVPRNGRFRAKKVRKTCGTPPRRPTGGR